MTAVLVDDDDAPRWTHVAQVLIATPYGETVPYEQLAAVLDLDPVADRSVMQAITRKAAARILRSDNRAIEPVRTVGYRVVKPEEQLRLAHGRQIRAQVQLVRGADLATYVDTDGMETTTVQGFRAVASALRAQSAFNERMNVRQRDLEESLASMRTRTTADGDAMRDRLARAERAIADLAERTAG